MINLQEHRIALINLRHTIEALETIRSLIEKYNQNLPGPAYCKFLGGRAGGGGDTTVQFDRVIAVEMLKKQEQSLVDYLAALGINA